VIIVGISASATRVPAFSSAVVGVGAALLAVIAAWDVRRVPIARAFALALGLVGVAALVRMGSIGLAVMAGERASAQLAGVARVAATGSFVLDASVLIIAMAILAAGSRKLTSPLTAVSLFLALVATRYALAGTADDAGTASLLLRRAAERLLTRPDPFGPVGLRVFVAALSVFIAIGALLARGRIPAFMGALSLLLVARGSPDMPLGALLLVVASLSLALASKDERGVWAALTSIQIRSRSGGASGEAEGAPRAPDTPMRAAGLSKGSGER